MAFKPKSAKRKSANRKITLTTSVAIKLDRDEQQSAVQEFLINAIQRNFAVTPYDLGEGAKSLMKQNKQLERTVDLYDDMRDFIRRLSSDDCRSILNSLLNDHANDFAHDDDQLNSWLHDLGREGLTDQMIRFYKEHALPQDAGTTLVACRRFLEEKARKNQNAEEQRRERRNTSMIAELRKQGFVVTAKTSAPARKSKV